MAYHSSSTNTEGAKQMANVRFYKADRFSYDIENRAFPLGKKFGTIEEVRAYAKAIVASPWWTERCSQPEVSVLSTRARRYGYSDAHQAAIFLPEWAWNEMYIIHELAHQFVDSRHGYSRHNEKFMYWLFRMHQQFNSCFDFPEKWEEADRLYLEAGINVGMTAPDIEAQNLRRVRRAPVEEGPVWRNHTAVSTKTHIRVPDVHRRVVAAGKSVSSMVKAMGGDKGKNEPIAEWWRPVYAGTSRWLPRECLQHFDQLSDARR